MSATTQRVEGSRKRQPSARVMGAPGRNSSQASVLAPALDLPLIAILATLLALGLVMVYSASFVQAQLIFGKEPAYFFLRQVVWVVLSLGALIVMASIPYRFWQRAAVPVMLVALVALVAVLVFGDLVHGARRTLLHGSVQPSELVKLAVVIYTAAWVASKGRDLSKVTGGLIPFAVLIGLVAGLVMLERSFSVTIIIVLAGVTIFFVGGGDLKQMTITGLIAGLVLALLIWQSDYASNRVEKWWMTLSDPNLAPYDVSKAMEILRQHGGIGTRPENFIQKSSVPLLWSDYLFANVGADLGFVGTVGVVALFAALGYRGLGIALNAPDKFGALTAIGITAWILVQATIHMGASLALIPATGIPLPFMSYGGSSLLACMLAMGLLLSISRSATEKKAPYASFAFGWRNWRPRLPDTFRGTRARTDRSDDGQRVTRPGNNRRARSQAGSRRHSDQHTIDEPVESGWRSSAGKPPSRRRRAARRSPAKARKP